MSVATPMVSPSMVSEARSLCARRALKHSARLSRMASIGAEKHLLRLFQSYQRSSEDWNALSATFCIVKRWLTWFRLSPTIVSGWGKSTANLPREHTATLVSRRNVLMSRMQTLITLALGACLVPGVSTSRAATPPDRQIAVTIDDLPAGNASSMPAAEITEMTTKLLAALREQKIPAVGFVNERKLYRLGEVDERIKALDMWLEAGFELGNHTFSHTSLNKAGLKAFEDDV